MTPLGTITSESTELFTFASLLESWSHQAIGLSNYCPSCMECLKDEEVQPMVNQVMYHVGMFANAQPILALRRQKLGSIVTRIVLQNQNKLSSPKPSTPPPHVFKHCSA